MERKAMKLVKPSRLHRGDTVGVFSPSWPITNDTRQRFDEGIERLKSFGLNVKLGKHVFNQYYYSAGTREERLEDLHDLWTDPQVKMVLMSQGGNTANQLLDGIDYNLLRRNPKIIAGISDGTVLLNAIYAEAGLVTYHGPDLIWTFGQDMSNQIEENIRGTFFDARPQELQPNKNWHHQTKSDIEYMGWRCLREGEASGRLVGGHVRVFANTVLAGFEPELKNSILFLEGTDNVGRTNSFITALKLHNVFDLVSGVILGWFEDSELEEKALNRSVGEVFLEETKEYEFPVIEIGELGHNVENYVLPIGCKATIDATKKRISIDEPAVT
jgi:muramoyltetrapeptide carboxypeptidase